ncbi:Hsp20/alpha crystallin family protein [Nocardia sp. CDC159]|uniref:Hsp20/alpha crystallin family protein n=1 Tax=Nocardia pulmonis TaxID=2951408 RepID=A0A9X2EBD2_9NOCA|nr:MULTISPECIES: Hsp20/alpha crystallin family protein [Nocardia]MCM6776118.1 Hsp20/alpha crystallin family protein [Nocardia pulmonis]MCM6788555.1 Hsp20/alpha crystallin family protein [Nocardia sp. CDC159]
MLRFDPFHDIDTVARQLLGETVGSARAPRFMPMDLFKAGDHYVLNADLPGVDPGSVEVSVDNGTLTLKAQRSLPSDQNVQWVASERFAGSYMRQLSLGEGIDTDHISATYNDGVLSVTLPIAEKAKPRRIEIGGMGKGPKTIEASSGSQSS